MNLHRLWTAILAIAGLAMTGCGAPAPRIVCDAPTFDFGERFADDPPVVHTFRLRNAGNVTLELGDVSTDCGCTASRLSANTLRPGETAELTATLTLRGRSGSQRKTLAILSNDPRQPELVLTLVGAVTPEVEIRPMGALLGIIPMDRETTFDIRITFPPERSNTITGIRTNASFLTADLRVNEERRDYTITLRIDPAQASGSRSGALQAFARVDTEKPLIPDIQIPVVAHLAVSVRILPDRIAVPATGNEPLIRQLLVRPGTARDTQVEEILTPNPGIRSTIRPAAGGGFQVLIEGIRPADLAADDAVILRVRHADGVEEFRVPLVREPAP